MKGKKRLKKDLIELSKFGRHHPTRISSRDQLDPGNGIYRMTGTEADRKARDYIVKRMENAGLQVRIDKVGNIFGRLEGDGTGKKAVMSGSHLDSVPDGGMFDGAVGVVNALEAVRRIQEQKIENERPIEVVVFSAEEGSAFPVGLLGSSVLVGKLSREEAYNLENEQGETYKEVLEKIGYRGRFEKAIEDVKYFLETHVEQGPILDEENIPVGVVEKITGINWIFSTFEGIPNHAGTTPMNMRTDALLAASEVVQFVNRRAKEIGKAYDTNTVGTVGKLDVHPNRPNIIPGKVQIGIDIRDVVKEHMETLTEETVEKIEEMKNTYGIKVKTEIPEKHMPASLSQEVAENIAASASQLDITYKFMNSGAGHDAQNIAQKVKTGMLFVPSVDGVSHSPIEWTSWEDIEKGAKVLTRTLKQLSNK